jgi:multiple sugar transport system permease protein
MKKTRSIVRGYGFGFLSFVGFMWFYLVPLLYGFFQTLIWPGGGIRWKGFKEYQDLLESGTFRLALGNTGIFVLIGIPVLLGLTILIAYLMDQLMNAKAKGISFWFAVHLLPMILPSVVIAKVLQIFFAQYGVVNGALVQAGLEPVRWLHSEWTFWILCVVFWWKNTGYSMVVLLSGLQNMEPSQKEAASLDGAGKLTIYFRIILPQMMPFIRFIIVMGVIGVFKLYRESYLLLGDSPGDEVYMVQNFLNNNFASLNYNRTLAASAVLFVLIGAVLILLFRFTERRRRHG